MKAPTNITELRDDLLQEYALSRVDPKRLLQSREVSNVAGKVIGTVAAQLKYAELRGEMPDIPFLGSGGIKVLTQAKRLT